MKSISRKEFITQVGAGAAMILLPACFATCKKSSTSSSSSSNTTTSVDFTVSVASGALASNGGYLVQNGVIIARTMSGTYLAVAAACTHERTNVQYSGSSNTFICPNHGAKFDATGKVINGPATKALQQYNTSLNGTTLRVYS